jgi:uncharacterized delta-60 repeat protein
MKKNILLLINLIGVITCNGQLFDNSFNGTGVWNKQIGNSYNELNVISLQSTGEILLGGSTQSTGNDTSNALIGRITANGILDNTFNGVGYAQYKLSASLYNSAQDLLYLNNKIYYCDTKFNGTKYVELLTRLNLNGSLDNSFNSGSAIFIDSITGASSSSLTSLNATTTGNIIALGTASVSLQTNLSGFSVAQNATLVNSFGSNGGLYNTSIGIPYVKPIIQPDNKILLVVNDSLIRLNTDGTFDNTFGTNGIQLLSSLIIINGIAIQKDGKIVLCGNGGNGNFYIERHNTDGSIDNTFGNSGKVIVPFSGITAIANAVIVDTTSVNGNIFAVGYSSYNGGTRTYFALARISPLDGMVEAQAEFQPNSLISTANNVLLQSNGYILIGGNSSGYPVTDMIVTRIVPNFATLIATSVEDAVNISNSFTLYPNPASQNVTVNSTYNIQEIKVLDVLGNEVINQTANGNAQINVSTLPKGLYNFVITTDKGTGSKKVSVQ